MKEIYGWYEADDDKSLELLMKHNRKQFGPEASITDHQKDKTEAVLNAVKDFNVALDVGASYGLLSYVFSKRFQVVHAFEPIPKVYECLLKNLETQNLTNVKAYNLALGSENKELYIKSEPDITLGAHLTGEIKEDGYTYSKINVVTLDSLGIKNVSLLKIDVEGFELLVLKGGIETIRRDRPVIFFETKEHTLRYGYQTKKIITTLYDEGYILKQHWKKDALMIPKEYND